MSNGTPSLTFHGAAGEVTGSMHLLHAGGKTIALDCGLFQGRRAEAARKNLEHPCDPRDIHAVVLSHAHIDHSGKLPRLVRDGFAGDIFCTPATRDLCAVMLADSAHIQEEDAKHLNEKNDRAGRPLVEPFYDARDAVAALRLMKTVGYGRAISAAPGVHATFFEAGHMLGSAGILIEIAADQGKTTRLVFTGDMGRFDTPILFNPAPLPACDYLICESTYGGRATAAGGDLHELFLDVVQSTVERQGKVVIPAFSVGRTQTIVYTLTHLIRAGRLTPVPIYVDSPLAINATEVFRMHPECYDEEARARLADGIDILGGESCVYVRSVDDSKAINRRRESCVVIAASGMCEAGRILHHLKNNISDPRNTILIVGFQAKHTLGRRIVEREPRVKIYGDEYPVKARVQVLNGFSSHADAGELRRQTAPLAADCRRAFLVHGESDQAGALRDTMRASGYRSVEIPQRGDRFALD